MRDGEYEVEHGWLAAPCVSILLEDAGAIGECIADGSVELGDDGLEECACCVWHWQELVAAERGR